MPLIYRDQSRRTCVAPFGLSLARYLRDLLRMFDNATCRKSWRFTASTLRTVSAVALRCGLSLDDADGPLGRGKNNRIFQRNQRVNFARFRV